MVQHPAAVPIFKHESRIFTGKKKAAEISRIQFPLTLAWALTIHKVQGLTVNKIVVSMQHSYNCGQAYVAFSRVRSLKELYLLDFDPTKIMVNTEVEKQMQELHKVPLTLLENPNMVQVSDNWIKIGTLNVHGYLSHISDIKKDPYVNKLDVICFTETHLHPDNNLAPNVLPRGYGVFRFDRDEAHLQGNITQGGGVMILAKDLLKL